MEVFFNNITPEEGTTEKLMQDLRRLREDTEELFRATGEQLGRQSREKFLSAVEHAKAACHEVQDRAAAGARQTDQTIHKYPFSAVGVAFGLGLIVGIMALRK